MCISDISASINTEFGNYSTVGLSQSRFPSLAPHPWRPRGASGTVSCSIFWVSESVQTKDRLNDCVDFVYLFVGSGSDVSSCTANLPTRKIYTNDGFNFVCDDSHEVLQWLSGNTSANQFISADQAVPGTKLVSWDQDIYQYVTVVSTSYQEEGDVSVNWLTTGTNSYQLANRTVVKGFTGDLCTCTPSASILGIPCNSTLSFCVENIFSMSLSGSFSSCIGNTTKTWKVTDCDGTVLIPQTTSSATALDGNLNLQIGQGSACCTASWRVDCTHLHASNSAFYGTETVAGATLPRGQISKLLFRRLDTSHPYTSPYMWSGLAGVPQYWLVLTVSGTKADTHAPKEKFNINMGLAEKRIVVPTGSNVEGSVDNLVQHINASSSHPDFTEWLVDVSASKHGTTELVLHREIIGQAQEWPNGIGWQAYYINYRYFDEVGGVATGTPEASTGNLSAGDGLLLGTGGNQTTTGELGFTGGTSSGSTEVTLSFTSSCDPNNLPQCLNVCYEESIVLGSELAASSSCCFLLQLNKQPYWNGSSSYCQQLLGPYVDLNAAFGACNYDTLELNTDAIADSNFIQNDPERIGNWFYTDPVTLGFGSIVLNFTASVSNSLCLNSASGQPSFSVPQTPTSTLTPGCCTDVSGAITVYFSPGVSAGPDSVQCWPTMSLNGSTVYNFPTMGNPTWSLSGGLMNNGSAPTLTNLILGTISASSYGANSDSHSLQTEAYFGPEVATKVYSGIYTMSLTAWNGPCSWSDDVNIKIVSVSSNDFAGPDQTFCNISDTFNMSANGTNGMWSVISPPPPAPQPVIYSSISPTTKIQQNECSTYTYGWTIASQSNHVLNGKTYSLTCEETDEVVITILQTLNSASIVGVIHTEDTVSIQTASVYTAGNVATAPYDITIIGCSTGSVGTAIFHDFSFQGTVDASVTEATWSVYMDFLDVIGAPVAHFTDPTPSDRAGIMGKFSGSTLGTILTSESNYGVAVEQGNIPPMVASPILTSVPFYFSSSNSQSFHQVQQYVSLETNSDCACSASITYANLWFKPGIINFSFVPPTPTDLGLGTSNETTFVTADSSFVTEPTLGVTVPMYKEAVMISFHSGSNNISPTTRSSVVGKVSSMRAPYLTMSFCEGLNYPISPILKKHNGDTRGSVDAPTISSDCEYPVWPGPSSFPSRSLGITSGSMETLGWKWKARQIAIYNAAGAVLTHGAGGIPSAVVTGSFTDTMTSESFQECPTFFPANRSDEAVTGFPEPCYTSYNHSGHNAYGGITGYSTIASQSVMFEVTLSRFSNNQLVEEVYTSQSIIFWNDNS